MSPIDCRRLIPLFDEPEFKAIYHVTVIHPEGTTALANAKERAGSNAVPLSVSYRPVFCNF